MPRSNPRKQFSFSAVAHQQFHGNRVVFLQFSERPMKELFHVFRENPACKYRCGPTGMGWHIHLAEHTNDLVKAITNLGYKQLADSIIKAGKTVLQSPETVPCPSRGRANQSHNASRRHGVPQLTVNKIT